jgi:hypoxanthine phosphoribosyltransferase
VYVAVATDKREDSSVGGIQIDFLGARVPNEFLVGYGMDYNNHFRNLDRVAVLSLSED